VERNALLAALLDTLLPLLPAFEAEGLEPWRERWLQRNAFPDCDVRLQLGDRQVFGRMLGIGQRGELRLDVGDTEQVFDGGEISLRLAR
jgi:BirA family biotin operon repressor/biotin-[acetyl-CoA-carboxylase] ligase